MKEYEEEEAEITQGKGKCVWRNRTGEWKEWKGMRNKEPRMRRRKKKRKEIWSTCIITALVTITLDHLTIFNVFNHLSCTSLFQRTWY